MKRILLVDQKAAECAKKEIDFLKNVPRHRAIVELVASELSSKEALLMFEFCGGGSVYSLIERRLEQRRPLKEDEVWAIFHATCEAVEHLHSQEPPIIHRDLKGESLFVGVVCSFLNYIIRSGKSFAHKAGGGLVRFWIGHDSCLET